MTGLKSDTARDIAARLMDLNPTLRIAVSTDGAAVGVYVERNKRFMMVVSRTINGMWVDLEGFEPLINGQPPYAADRWEELHRDDCMCVVCMGR